MGRQVFSFSYPSQMSGAGMTWARPRSSITLGDPAGIAQGAIAAHSNGFKSAVERQGIRHRSPATRPSITSNSLISWAAWAALGPEAIEVWNEQNIDREWPAGQIGGSAYAQMLAAAYQAIKNANPNVLVISGAPAPTGFFGGCSANGCDDAPFLQQMAQAGAAQFMDCLGIHYNEGILSPTQSTGDPRGNGGHYTRYYSGMVNTYASVFPSKPLCFTELGYLSADGYGPLPPGFEWAVNTSAQEQAVWLAEAVTLARQSNRVRLLIVWNVDATEFGADPQAGYAIIRPDNTCNACVTMGAAMAGS
ncbi:MAG: hypothetical protein H6671_15500 [Anaerolineaceae bacterium]|nr:hypothetical protein [Anaerolineaceae bacterium]